MFLSFSQDSDKDGVIDDHEFLKVIEAMYGFKGKSKKEYPPEKCVRDIFSRIDGNGDRKLTKNEFIEGCLENKNILVYFFIYLFLILFVESRKILNLLFFYYKGFDFSIWHLNNIQSQLEKISKDFSSSYNHHTFILLLFGNI